MPRTLAENATYIANTIKPAIKQAIEDKGVTVPSTDSFLDYADRIGEISGGGSGYQLKDLPTGSISTVTDAAELPLNALKVSVEAWQEGSGDPSPSNIRPIHGWDSGEIGVVGKNWAKYDNANNPNRSRYTYSEESAERTVCAKTAIGGLFALQYLIQLREGETYCFSFDNYTFDGVSQNSADVYIYSNGLWESLIAHFRIKKTGTAWTSSYTGTAVLGIFNTQSAGTEIVFEKLMISKGSTPTTYEPYQSKQYTHAFTDSQGNPLTCYGAEWNVVDGSLSVTDGYIASYNGETLPSTWISDRDVYASRTTPTTGAEIVYKLATPTTIDLSPLSIRLNEGTNNLYADCGEVIEGEYFVGETKAYDLVEYIESDGTQVIDTGRQVVQGQTIEVTFEGSRNQTAYAWIFGGITSSDYYGYQFPNSSAVYLYNGGTSASSQSGFASDMITQKALTFNGSANANIHILGLWDGSAYSNQGKFKVYFLDINGDYFVPAKRRSDGVYGLYDIANSQFLTDVASGNALTGGASLGIRIG
jgi:hypothetical protein